MNLKDSIALIHISANHKSGSSRRMAIAAYLRDHPEIDREEVLAMMPETSRD